MSKHGQDLERAWDNRVPERPHSVEERYPQPTWFSEAGQLDRRNENNHIVQMRQIARSIELDSAQTFQRYQHERNILEADSRLLSDMMWSIQRAKKEREVLAGDDPELHAFLGTIADDFFHRRREQGFRAFED